jgi:FAD/FMN-containing dehydrogenase
MRADGIHRVAEHLGTSFPLAPVPPSALLVELAGDDPMRDAGALLDQLGLPDDATVVADDDHGIAGLWRWREAHPEAAAALGLSATLAPFATEVDAVVDAAAPGAITFVYGHLADGNLHVNIVGPAPDDDAPVDAVLDLVLRLGGSVSAEHGIGIAKRAWLVRQRGEAAVRAMRAVKRALDPDGVLNPGVLLPSSNT